MKDNNHQSNKVSIITVSFNSINTITRTICSVIDQTYSNIEYIIIDGNSNDGTKEIIESFGNKIQKFISEPDKGIYDAMNKGIKVATGDIVGILNSDDILYDNNVIEDIVKAFKEEDIDCCYGDLVYLDRNNINKITRKWISSEFKEGAFEKSWTPPHPTFYCKREIYEKYGYYRIDFKIASDTELMYRFLEKHKIKSKYICRMMVKMRDGGISNRGLNSIRVITNEMKRAIIEHGGRFNLIKYIFYKFLKIRQIIFRNFKRIK